MSSSETVYNHNITPGNLIQMMLQNQPATNSHPDIWSHFGREAFIVSNWYFVNTTLFWRRAQKLHKSHSIIFFGSAREFWV